MSAANGCPACGFPPSQCNWWAQQQPASSESSAQGGTK